MIDFRARLEQRMLEVCAGGYEGNEAESRFRAGAREALLLVAEAGDEAMRDLRLRGEVDGEAMPRVAVPWIRARAAEVGRP